MALIGIMVILYLGKVILDKKNWKKIVIGWMTLGTILVIGWMIIAGYWGWKS